jgi:uncharacterized protein (DUF2336 family)
MSDMRPSVGELDGAAQLLASVRTRLSAMVADLALPETGRLTEWQRTMLASLYATLVRAIEDELRAALAPRFAGEAGAALSSARVEIALPVLSRAGGLADRRLLVMLLRRVEEHRLARRGSETALLVDLAGEEEEEIAAEAMALLIAHSGRLDAFCEPLIARVELPAELQHDLVWTVAAALRAYLVERHGIEAPAADEAAATAANGLLSGYDEGQGVQALALRLARRLAARRSLDDGLLARALPEGGLPLFLAALSIRTALDPDSVWEILADETGRGAALLLRAAGVSRQAAAAIFHQIGGEDEMLITRLDLFDATLDEEARRFLALWRLDPAYRDAIARLAA